MSRHALILIEAGLTGLNAAVYEATGNALSLGVAVFAGLMTLAFIRDPW